MTRRKPTEAETTLAAFDLAKSGFNSGAERQDKETADVNEGEATSQSNAPEDKGVTPASDDTHENKNPDSPSEEGNDSSNSSPNHDWKKRADDRQAFINKLQEEGSAKDKLIADLQKKNIEIPTTEEELKLFKEKNPDQYNVIAGIAMSIAKDLDSATSSELEKVKARQEALDAENAMTDILESHPDAKDIKASPEFADWYNLQSDATKGMFNGEVRDVVRGISLYKTEQGIKTTKKTPKEESVDNATTINSGPGRPSKEEKMWRESDIYKMKDEVYRKHQDEINKAQKEGRVINDMS